MSAPSQAFRRVLVLDADMSHTLAITRSLRRMGLSVDAGSHLPKPITAFSRTVDQTFLYPDPTHAAEPFVDWLAGHLERVRYDLVIPVTERTVIPLDRYRARLAGQRIALAPEAALPYALDKAKTLALARQLNIPAPRSIAIDRMDQLDAHPGALDYPVVVKPARSFGARERELVQLGVSYAFNANELRAQVEHALRFGSVLLQEYAQGEGVGIELIADSGRIVQAFQHLRLHEVPLTGGGSSLRQSVAVEPALLDAAAQLMQALNWHGVAMVEFKRDADSGAFRLMEINGRFWGSLPLAVAAGADFPAMLYELLVLGRITPRPASIDGILCRKLSSDLYWTELVLRREAPSSLVKLPGKGRVLRDWLLVFSPRHRFDIQQWRDPLPGLVDIGRIALGYWARVVSLVQMKRLARRMHAAWRDGTVARRLAHADKVLFVCYGNINRSPLAERCFRAHPAGMRIACQSAGFHEEAGRPADPGIVTAAQAEGIAFDQAASRRVDRDLIESSGIIFVMEYQHYWRIVETWPETRGRVFLLSPNGEIDDPYGKSPEQYARCVREVSAATKALGDLWLEQNKH